LLAKHDALFFIQKQMLAPTMTALYDKSAMELPKDENGLQRAGTIAQRILNAPILSKLHQRSYFQLRLD
jgi:hypothetical protein